MKKKGYSKGARVKKKGFAKGARVKKKGFAKGAKATKLKMVKKNGKMVPFYAADGKGKMYGGGMAKKKGMAKGGAMKKKGASKRKGFMGGGMGMQPEMMQEDPMTMGMRVGGAAKKKKKKGFAKGAMMKKKGFAKGAMMKKKGFAKGARVRKMNKGGFLAPPARPIKMTGMKKKGSAKRRSR